MAIPCGPQQDDAKKATRPGCEEARTRRSEPARRAAAQQAAHHRPPLRHQDRAAAPFPNAASVTADSGGLHTKKLLQPATAASIKKSGEGEGEQDLAVADAYTDSGEVDPKKKSVEDPAVDDANTDSGEVDPKKKSGEDPAPAVASNFGQVDPKKRLQAAAATSGKKRSEDRAPAVASDFGDDVHPKKRLQATAGASGKKSGEEEDDPAAALAPGDNERKDETGASWVRKLFSRPWPQGPDFLWKKKTYLLNRLFECCGLLDIITTKDLRTPHVNEEITLVCEAKGYYKIKGSVAKKLSEFYSSFRAVLGDGECFYRSFIYSYLEHILDLDDTCEENRLLCAVEKISSVCVDLQWLYVDFQGFCKAFIELVQKVKSWKTQRREVRRMLLLTYFGDYTETEAIFTFLRIATVVWILTHREFFSAFLEDGTDIEEHCRLEILRSRSYADNMVISALSEALGIQFRIFCLGSGHIQDICMIPSSQSSGVPTVSLAYTGIHYDILYPI